MSASKVVDDARAVLGESPIRPDAGPKVSGSYSFASDLTADGTVWGATLRSPHPHARIRSIDISLALSIDGVRAVITADDVQGRNAYGLVDADQPVFAADVVRFVGEPIAAVAADDIETCQRALKAIQIDFELLPPLIDPEQAIDPSTPAIHPMGNIVRHQRIVTGDSDVQGRFVVEGTYEIGMQDQAFLGLEAALAIPDPDGHGVELHVATQWLHEDRHQIASCLGMNDDAVRLVLAGVGGAFGGREDISLQVHTCMLALAVGRPVRMHYSRAESFLGHVHRHPASIWMRHHADETGRLVKIEARFVFDGGAYASTSSAVLINAVTHTQGPYRCENAVVDGYAVRTNNLPCGAMRGFGVVQACFAHESQMDRLAAVSGLGVLEIRRINAMKTGDRLITGQVMTSVAPVLRCIDETEALPFPPDAVGEGNHPYRLPGGAGLTADEQHVVRGIGYAVSMKNLMYSEGFDDFSSARCSIRDGAVFIKFATAEVGQGFITIAAQICRTVLGVDDVMIEEIDTRVGSAGSTSASRQTWMSGGAVDAACRLARDSLLRAVADRRGIAAHRLTIENSEIVDAVAGSRSPVSEELHGLSIVEDAVYRHRPTVRLNDLGQGDCHTAFAFAAHRAIVDVDLELGLVKVVQIATAQDVGRALNPMSVVGQIEGGIAQGLGLALMEEIIQTGGIVRNASFTDYLLPTIADMPPVSIALIEEPEPEAPLGAKGVGEPPTISSTPAIVAAIRDAINQVHPDARALSRVPVRPSDVVAAIGERGQSSED